jgi:hypothetical protein
MKEKGKKIGEGKKDDAFSDLGDCDSINFGFWRATMGEAHWGERDFFGFSKTQRKSRKTHF